jgi:hypothetical protein
MVFLATKVTQYFQEIYGSYLTEFENDLYLHCGISIPKYKLNQNLLP